MFKVFAIESKEEQKKVCERCGTEYIPAAFAYGAYDVESPDDKDGDVIGVCQFSFMGECRIMCLSPASGKESDEAMLILGFAVLEFLRRCGFGEVRATVPENYAAKLGFRKTDDEYILDLKAPRTCGGH